MKNITLLFAALLVINSCYTKLGYKIVQSCEVFFSKANEKNYCMSGNMESFFEAGLRKKNEQIGLFYVPFLYHSQNKNMNTEKKNMNCEPSKGKCETTSNSDSSINYNISALKKRITVLYFTDPICSACWGIEPQLRKLKLEYGSFLNIEYHYGGLLPDWSYNAGGISKPADVAHHWDEVSAFYNMPIDGDIWLENPLHSSYPPSIACKAAELQNKEKATLFLRKLREMVFLEKKNITEWVHINYAAIYCGLDTIKLKVDFEKQAQSDFDKDLELCRKTGVRGFPTLLFFNDSGKMEYINSFKPYSHFESIVLKLIPETLKNEYPKDWKSLFAIYPTLTTREFSELKNISFQESENELHKLFTENKIEKMITKNGNWWKLK